MRPNFAVAGAERMDEYEERLRDNLAQLRPLSGSLLHELLQLLHGIHHHGANLRERWPRRRPPAPPTLESEDANPEECRRFLLANVSVANLLLCGWQ